MFGLGFGEILLVAVVLLLAVGPERIPSFMREAGKIYAQVKRTSDELRRALVLEADRMDAEERYRKLRERQQAAEEARKAAQAATGSTAQAPNLPPPKPVEVAAAAADDDPLAPAPPRPNLPPGPPAAPSAPAADLPEGVTAEEWSRLPPRVQEMLRATQKPPGSSA